MLAEVCANTAGLAADEAPGQLTTISCPVPLTPTVNCLSAVVTLFTGWFTHPRVPDVSVTPRTFPLSDACVAGTPVGASAHSTDLDSPSTTAVRTLPLSPLPTIGTSPEAPATASATARPETGLTESGSIVSSTRMEPVVLSYERLALSPVESSTTICRVTFSTAPNAMVWALYFCVISYPPRDCF